MPTVREALAAGAARLTHAGVENARSDAEWLLAGMLGVRRADLFREPGRQLATDAAAAYTQLVERRAGREPLQYVLGWEEFMGLRFTVNPAVLIPRPETELLVEAALAHLRAAPGEKVLAADIGTGSGAIAVAVAHREARCRVWAVDVSAEALVVAAENARANGVAQRVQFAQGDLLAPLGHLQGRLQALLSNPPYVAARDMPGLQPEVRDYEPHIALTTGTPDDLLFYRRLAAGGPRLLAPGGMLAVEVGLGQAPAVASLLVGGGLTGARVLTDLAGVERVVVAYQS